MPGHPPGTGRRIAVVGAGGIGAYYVARLSATGANPLAVARGEHLAAIVRQGLCVEHPEHPFHGPVDACDMAGLSRADPRAFAAVVLLTKATATAEIAQRLRTWLGDAPVAVASLQNGVDNESVLEDALGRERVIGGYSVRLGGHVAAPGRVRCVGDALTCIGAWPDDACASAAARARVRALADTLGAAGLATEVFPDVRREMWRKLVLNAAVNPLSALLEWDTRRLSHDPQVSALVRAIMAETVAAGRADGVALEDSDAREMFELIHGFPPIRTSMLVDLDRGREPETDAICTAVLRRAERHGTGAPVLSTVSTLLAAKLARA